MDNKQLKALFTVWIKIRHDWKSFDSFVDEMKEVRGHLKKDKRSEPHGPDNSYWSPVKPKKTLPVGITEYQDKLSASIVVDRKQIWLGSSFICDKDAQRAIDYARDIEASGIYDVRDPSCFRINPGPVRQYPKGISIARTGKYRADIYVARQQVWLGDHMDLDTAKEHLAAAVIKRDTQDHSTPIRPSEWRNLA